MKRDKETTLEDEPLRLEGVQWKKKSPDIFLAPVFLSWCSDAFCKDLQVVLSLYKGILGRNCVTLFSLSSSKHICSISSVQSLSHVRLFSTPWAAAPQASLSITNSRTLLKLMSIESVMPSNHLILCHPLLFPPSVFPTIRVFSSESVPRIRWPKDWSCSFSVSPSNEYSGLISFDGLVGSPCCPRDSQESSPTPTSAL